MILRHGPCSEAPDPGYCRRCCSLEASVFTESYGAGVPYKQRVGEIRGVNEAELVIDPVFGKDTLGICVVFRVIGRQESDVDDIVVHSLHDGIADALRDHVKASGDRVRGERFHLLDFGVFRFGVDRRLRSAGLSRSRVCGSGAGGCSVDSRLIGGTAVSRGSSLFFALLLGPDQTLPWVDSVMDPLEYERETGLTQGIQLIFAVERLLRKLKEIPSGQKLKYINGLLAEITIRYTQIQNTTASAISTGRRRRFLTIARYQCGVHKRRLIRRSGQ